MPQMRISQDVWQLGQSVAQARGLNNPRIAIEAIVRIYAHSYLQGSQPVVEPTAKPIVPTSVTNTSVTNTSVTSATVTSAKDALSHLIEAL